MSVTHHAPDPTRPLANWSPVARVYFMNTALCRRRPTAHGMYIVAKHANVDCARCRALLRKESP